MYIRHANYTRQEKNGFTVNLSRKLLAVPTSNRRDDLKYWKEQVGDYVRKKRGSRKQEEINVTRQTLSLIENGQMNFSLENILEVLHAVGGDISEAFQAKVPTEIPKERRLLIKKLLDILDYGGKEAEYISGNIETFHLAYCRGRRGR